MPAEDLDLYAKWHEKLCTITFLDPDGSSSSAPLTQTVNYGNTPTAPSWQPTMRVENGKIFNNWYYDQAGTKPFDYTVPIYDDLTVYGKRYDYAYWLGKAGNQVWPMKELVKSPDELQADIKVLKDENHAVYSEEEYNKVKTEYETYMNEDQVVLYTYVGTGDNKYDDNNLMEFRIVEVGRHDNGNGTKSEGVLTFQSKSCLLNAYKLNNADEYTSWKATLESSLTSVSGLLWQLIQRLILIMRQTKLSTATTSSSCFRTSKFLDPILRMAFTARRVRNMPTIKLMET